MNPFDTIDRLYKIHQLILQENTGTPDEFAAMFHLSRRQIYNIMSNLKDYGVDIRFSRTKQAFYYANEFKMPISTLHPLSGDDKKHNVR